MEKTFVCIVCPNGCRLTARKDETGAVTVTGNTCPRGEAFARAELTNPTRSLTTTVGTVFPDRPVLPVRTAGELPKEKLADAMRAIGAMRVRERMRCGDIVARDLLGTGVDLIATDNL